VVGLWYLLGIEFLDLFLGFFVIWVIHQFGIIILVLFILIFSQRFGEWGFAIQSSHHSQRRKRQGQIDQLR
jgi:hypothetical protein